MKDKEIAASPPGANGLLFLPYIMGERSPRWNSEARGDMLWACIGGILINLYIIMEVFRAETDLTVLNVIGDLPRATWPAMRGRISAAHRQETQLAG